MKSAGWVACAEVRADTTSRGPNELGTLQEPREGFCSRHVRIEGYAIWARATVCRVLWAMLLALGLHLKYQGNSSQGISRMGHDPALICEGAGCGYASLVPDERLHFHLGKIGWD